MTTSRDIIRSADFGFRVNPKPTLPETTLSPIAQNAQDMVQTLRLKLNQLDKHSPNNSANIETTKVEQTPQKGWFGRMTNKIHTGVTTVIEKVNQTIQYTKETVNSLITPKHQEEKGRNRWNIKNVVIPTATALSTLGIVGMMMLGTAQSTNREIEDNQDQQPKSPTVATITPDRQNTTLIPTIEPYIPNVESPEYAKPNLPIIEPAKTANVYTSKSGDTVSDILFTHGYDPYGDDLVQFIKINAADLQRFAIKYKSKSQLIAVVNILNNPNFRITEETLPDVLSAANYISADAELKLPPKAE